MEQRLLKCKPPRQFTRLPRKLTIAQWKANEFRSFVLHYSVFCLRGILKNKYLEHWILLVNAYKLFYSAEISPVELQAECENLKEFAARVSSLYGAWFSLLFSSSLNSVLKFVIPLQEAICVDSTFTL